MINSPTVSIVITVLVIAWLSGLTFLLVRILRTFSRLTKGISEKDLKAILEEVMGALKKGEKASADLETRMEALKESNKVNFQKIGLIRFNPFSDTGGNQSFVLALLDGNDSGFVITALHSREATRIFAKPVNLGKEEGFEFSKEEIQAILEAQKKGRHKMRQLIG